MLFLNESSAAKIHPMSCFRTHSWQLAIHSQRIFLRQRGKHPAGCHSDRIAEYTVFTEVLELINSNLSLMKNILFHQESNDIYYLVSHININFINFVKLKLLDLEQHQNNSLSIYIHTRKGGSNILAGSTR
jgi:hypothetical protein